MYGPMSGSWLAFGHEIRAGQQLERVARFGASQLRAMESVTSEEASERFTQDPAQCGTRLAAPPRCDQARMPAARPLGCRFMLAARERRKPADDPRHRPTARLSSSPETAQASISNADCTFGEPRRFSKRVRRHAIAHTRLAHSAAIGSSKRQRTRRPPAKRGGALVLSTLFGMFPFLVKPSEDASY
jgi:hypothetical protein